MNSDTVSCLGSGGFHRMHYTEWGDPANDRIVICVHGLTRSGRDFDFLARVLERDFRVICPDVAGRGRSDWMHSKADYDYPQYMADMTALIARITAGPGAKTLYWVGTSMGGIIGMLLGSRPGSPLAKLILNDVGTIVPKAALERIAAYVGKDPRFATYDELESYVRIISAPFGPLTDDQWRHLTVHTSMRHADGSWGFRYDPAIGSRFQDGQPADVELWSVWDSICCPTLLLRGAESDLLLRDNALAMTQRGPKPQMVEFSGVGHAPMLMVPEQIDVVRQFLRG